MIKSFAALSVTTGVRLLTGLVLFVLIAREWTAAEFGQFMYLFSVAALLVLACEFGFGQQILREVGQTPRNVGPLMGRFLGAKLWLTALSGLLTVGFGLISALSWTDGIVLALLLAAGIAMSFADFFMAGFRAIGRYSEEARLSVIGNLAYFGLAAASLYTNTGPIGVAASLAAARCLHLHLSYRIFKKHVPDPLTLNKSARAAYKTIQSSSAYGADVAIGAAFVNLDSVLIAHTLGKESVAIYQAIGRFFQGACLLPPIFGSLFLPKLAAATDNKPLFRKIHQQLSIALLSSGAIGSIVFIFGEQPIKWLYQNSKIQDAANLLPWFAMLILVRYIASIHGAVLTSLGGQSSRAGIYVIALALMTITAPVLMTHLGVAGMILACTLAYAFLAIMFAWQSHRRDATPPATGFTAAIVLLIMTLCVWKIRATT